jgi:hypothetical protein
MSGAKTVQQKAPTSGDNHVGHGFDDCNNNQNKTIITCDIGAVISLNDDTLDFAIISL